MVEFGLGNRWWLEIHKEFSFILLFSALVRSLTFEIIDACRDFSGDTDWQSDSLVPSSILPPRESCLSVSGEVRRVVGLELVCLAWNSLFSYGCTVWGWPVWADGWLPEPGLGHVRGSWDQLGPAQAARPGRRLKVLSAKGMGQISFKPLPN